MNSQRPQAAARLCLISEARAKPSFCVGLSSGARSAVVTGTRVILF
jgi:hypothetical protein